MREEVSAVAVLENPRHEGFAQLVATARSPAQAYVTAGYAEKTAYTCGPRLLKVCSARDRIRELHQTIAQESATQAALDRRSPIRFCESFGTMLSPPSKIAIFRLQLGAELLGKELGMVQDWDKTGSIGMGIYRN